MAPEKQEVQEQARQQGWGGRRHHQVPVDRELPGPSWVQPGRPVAPGEGSQRAACRRSALHEFPGL